MKFTTSVLALAISSAAFGLPQNVGGGSGFACPQGSRGECCLDFNGPSGQGESYIKALPPKGWFLAPRLLGLATPNKESLPAVVMLRAPLVLGSFPTKLNRISGMLESSLNLYQTPLEIPKVRKANRETVAELRILCYAKNVPPTQKLFSGDTRVSTQANPFIIEIIVEETLLTVGMTFNGGGTAANIAVCGG
ncbi:hypothetical protein G7Y89_g6850 [Cudoniella acicularis]|uniref:Uncharacterized protein n=1 Tax=Cudoniella acicularis TaxID=354080 RepID=A0A8H4RLX2_9HELO|nr:hypothetical protein G7Y89_g6850 [Cudoniella acicularis]